jgi:hypothetical protein
MTNVIHEFMSVVGVSYSYGFNDKLVSPADIGEEGAGFTVHLSCD